MLEVNVIGVAHAIEAVLPGMIARGAGHIVGVASVAGYRGFPWMISYSASKAALIAYLEALRPGLRRRGVTVTTVCPGFVRTRMCTSVPVSAPGQDARARGGRPAPRPGRREAAEELRLPLEHADRPGDPEIHARPPVRPADAPGRPPGAARRVLTGPSPEKELRDGQPSGALLASAASIVELALHRLRYEARRRVELPALRAVASRSRGHPRRDRSRSRAATGSPRRSTTARAGGASAPGSSGFLVLQGGVRGRGMQILRHVLTLDRPDARSSRSASATARTWRSCLRAGRPRRRHRPHPAGGVPRPHPAMAGRLAWAEAEKPPVRRCDVRRLLDGRRVQLFPRPRPRPSARCAG